MVLCNNCKQIVEENIWPLHEASCYRRNYFCSTCKKVQIGKTREDHVAETHKLVPCPDCQDMVETWYLTGHKNIDCEYRKVHCEYCDLDWPMAVMEEHVATCGARTEPCLECGVRVQLRHAENHVCRTVVLPENIPENIPETYSRPESPLESLLESPPEFGSPVIKSEFYSEALSETVMCPYCPDKMKDYEELQMHVFQNHLNLIK